MRLNQDSLFKLIMSFKENEIAAANLIDAIKEDPGLMAVLGLNTGMEECPDRATRNCFINGVIVGIACGMASDAPIFKAMADDLYAKMSKCRGDNVVSFASAKAGLV